jgi:hypothetical protein
MPPTPEEVLKLAQEIKDTKAKLGELQTAWDAMFGLTHIVGSVPVSAPRAKRENSFSSRVEAVILGEPGRAFTIGQVAEILGAETLEVGRTLFRLYKTNRIANPQRGMYSTKRAEVTA